MRVRDKATNKLTLQAGTSAAQNRKTGESERASDERRLMIEFQERDATNRNNEMMIKHRESKIHNLVAAIEGAKDLDFPGD